MTDSEQIHQLERQLADCDSKSPADAVEKVDILNDLAWALSDTDMQRAYALSEQAYALASSLPDGALPDQAGMAYSLRTQGYINQRLGDYPLYRDTDAIRAGASLAAGFLAAGLALLLQRRFPGAVLIVGGFLAAGLAIIQALGPLLNPFPQWLVISLLVAGGIGGAIWTHTNRDTATIVLSALIGAGVLTDNLLEPMGIDEAHRFQVYAVLALAGIGFQLWRERREQRAASRGAEGASA